MSNHKPLTFSDLVKGGPYIGKRGGKWADPQHKIPWNEKKHAGKPAPKEKDHNTHEARELELFMDNSPEFVNEMRSHLGPQFKDVPTQRGSIVRNLVQKMAAGKYDHAQAGKLIGYMVDAAAKAYRKEHGMGGGTGFDAATRREVARRIADEFHDAAKAGEYDDHHSVSSGVHKKRAEAGGGVSKIAGKHGK